MCIGTLGAANSRFMVAKFSSCVLGISTIKKWFSFCVYLSRWKHTAVHETKHVQHKLKKYIALKSDGEKMGTVSSVQRKNVVWIP